MKKSFFYLLLLASALFVIAPAYSQKSSNTDLYYVNVQIIKAYQHNDGLHIIYRRRNMQTGEAFVPFKWFSPKDGRGEIRKINARISPYMSLFMRDGKFEFVKVSLPMNNPQHPVWGFIQNNAEYEGKFNHETLELEL